MADLISVIVGGVIGIAGSFGSSLWNQRQSRLAVRAAVRASISGILDLYEARDFARVFRRAIDGWREETLKDWPIFPGSEEVREDPILGTLGDKVGLLGAEAGDVVAFTNMVTGIDVNLRAVAKGQLDKLAPADRIKIFEEDLALWNRAEMLGLGLVKRLEYRSPYDTLRGWTTQRGG